MERLIKPGYDGSLELLQIGELLGEYGRVNPVFDRASTKKVVITPNLVLIVRCFSSITCSMPNTITICTGRFLSNAYYGSLGRGLYTNEATLEWKRGVAEVPVALRIDDETFSLSVSGLEVAVDPLKEATRSD
ncbi:MAG: hypothetical protein P4M11_06815 [Candidatus Pacebacteria bacterium]|nr:hypothetical protein [Candidatus Paceibacterota bacterium]